MAPTPRSTSGGSSGRKRRSRAEPARPEVSGPDTPQSPSSARPKPAAEATVDDRARRVVVTGGAGLVGRAVVRLLRERGDTVIALVRDTRRAPHLAELGAQLVDDDLSDVGRLVDALTGADAAIHAAGSYRIGVPKSERGAMWDANVGTTTRMLDAAEKAGTPRFVYVSTGNVYGNTRGRQVDESYRRNLAEGFLSWYDETKYGAHEVAEQRIADRAPVVIVLPSQVYGPGDRSAFGEQLRLAHEGRLRYRALDDVGVGLVHADDLAVGIVAALDRGGVGERYNLGGPPTTLADAVEVAARLGGHRAPAVRVPTSLLRVLGPAGRLVGQPNMRELIAASAGVTYWIDSTKAADELGFRPRDLETGFRDTFAFAAGSGAAA